MFEINSNCILCQCCKNSYPDNFEEVDGVMTVKEQPKEDIRDICPVGAIEEV